MNKLFSLSDAPQQAIATILQTWMQAHPLMAWLLIHPLLSLGLLLVVIVLLRGLLGAIARLTERIWIAILRAPVRLASWLFTLLTQWFVKAQPPPTFPEPPTQQDRLTVILNRLEAIQHEQDLLIKEVRSMLGSESIEGEPVVKEAILKR